MTVVPDAPGMFEVYNGDGESYVVDLVSGACTCPDAEYHEPEDGCKHLRRVEMEAGIRDVPQVCAEHAAPLDVKLAINARADADEPEPEPEPRIIPETTKPARAVMADGGQVLEPETRGSGAEEGRPEECICHSDDDLPCWPCFRVGFEAPDPTGEGMDR